MKKVFKYLLILLLIVLVGYKSVYIKRLSEMKKAPGEKFDAGAFSKELWKQTLPAKIAGAVEVTNLIRALETNPEDAFAKYSNALDIGNYRYSLVKVTGVVAVINENDIIMQVGNADSLMTMMLATEYVYGNAIRDASGLIDVKDFSNTADLNSVSEELNKIVRTTLLPPFKKRVKQGDKIAVTGAIEINKEHIKLNDLELIPVQLEILK